MPCYRTFIIPLLCCLSPLLFAQACDSLQVAGSNRWVPIAFTPTQSTTDSSTASTSTSVSTNTVSKDESPNASGIAYDLSRYIAQQLNLPIKIDDKTPWARSMRNLELGEIDMIAGAYFTKERNATFLMSQAFSQDTLSLYVKKGLDFPFNSLEDLIDKRVDIRRGSSNGQTFDEFARNRLNPLLLNTVDNYEQLFLRLDRFRTDYVILDTYTGNQVLKKLGLQGKIIPLKNPLVTNPIHYLISKKSPCSKHFEAIKEIINKAQENGVLEAIHQKYY